MRPLGRVVSGGKEPSGGQRGTAVYAEGNLTSGGPPRLTRERW
jgi:hypothetical protein